MITEEEKDGLRRVTIEDSHDLERQEDEEIGSVRRYVHLPIAESEDP